MCIDPVMISGFSVLIRHGEEGYKTQVKQIRVVGITTDQRGEMVSLRQICKLVIPLLSKPSAELVYDFSSPTVAVSIFISLSHTSEHCHV